MMNYTVPQLRKKVTEPTQEEKKTDVSLLEANTSAPSTVQEHDKKTPWTKTAMQEICTFLILSNIMVMFAFVRQFKKKYYLYIYIINLFALLYQLWIIPAFGVHPQFENGLGKQFFGLTAWFVMVNLGQPLGIFYRMHSVGALMELFITA